MESTPPISSHNDVAAETRYVVFLKTFLPAKPELSYHAYGPLRGDGTGLWTRCARQANGGVMAEFAVARKIGRPCKTCFGRSAK